MLMKNSLDGSNSIELPLSRRGIHFEKIFGCGSAMVKLNWQYGIEFPENDMKPLLYLARSDVGKYVHDQMI